MDDRAELIRYLRRALSPVGDDASDDEVLRVTAGTRLRAQAELHVALIQLQRAIYASKAEAVKFCAALREALTAHLRGDDDTDRNTPPPP